MLRATTTHEVVVADSRHETLARFKLRTVYFAHPCNQRLTIPSFNFTHLGYQLFQYQEKMRGITRQHGVRWGILLLVGILLASSRTANAIGNEDSPEEGYLVEYEDGTFEFIPHGAQSAFFGFNSVDVSETEVEVVVDEVAVDETTKTPVATTGVADGITTFLSWATGGDMLRRGSSESASKCGMKMVGEGTDSGRRGPGCGRMLKAKILRGSKPTSRSNPLLSQLLEI